MVGERMKYERVKRGKSLEEIGQHLGGLRRSTLSQYETGKRNPPLDVLIDLAYLYDVSLDYLVGMTDDPDPRYDQRDLKKIFAKSPLHYDGVYLNSNDLKQVRSVLKMAVDLARRRHTPIEERGQELATTI